MRQRRRLIPLAHTAQVVEGWVHRESNAMADGSGNTITSYNCGGVALGIATSELRSPTRATTSSAGRNGHDETRGLQRELRDARYPFQSYKQRQTRGHNRGIF
jgi:hypothetical protein